MATNYPEYDKIFFIKSKNDTSKCFNITNNNLDVSACDASNQAQQFTLNSEKKLRNPNNQNLCLDNENNNLVMGSCTAGNQNQVFDYLQNDTVWKNNGTQNCISQYNTDGRVLTKFEACNKDSQQQQYIVEYLSNNQAPAPETAQNAAIAPKVDEDNEDDDEYDDEYDDEDDDEYDDEYDDEDDDEDDEEEAPKQEVVETKIRGTVTIYVYLALIIVGLLFIIFAYKRIKKEELI
jgi:septum formation inhibitor MinC